MPAVCFSTNHDMKATFWLCTAVLWTSASQALSDEPKRTGAELTTTSNMANTNSLAQQLLGAISSGIVAARSSGVPEAKAKTEVANLMTVILKNPNMSGLAKEAALFLSGNMDDDTVMLFMQHAVIALSKYQDTDSYKTARRLVTNYRTDIDTMNALASVSKHIGAPLARAASAIDSMTRSDASAAHLVEAGIAQGSSILNGFGIRPAAKIYITAVNDIAAASIDPTTTATEETSHTTKIPIRATSRTVHSTVKSTTTASHPKTSKPTAHTTRHQPATTSATDAGDVTVTITTSNHAESMLLNGMAAIAGVCAFALYIL